MKLSDNSTPAPRLLGPRNLARGALLFLLVSIASGLLIGLLTLLGQGALPDDAVQLSNSGAVWVVIAVVLGRFAPSWQVASLAGFVALIGELIGYYTAAQLLIDASSTIASTLLWFAVAVVAGPLFGFAGFVSRNGHGRIQKLGNAALGAAFVGEGLYLMTVLPTVQTGIIWLAIALLTALVLNRTAATRLQGALITAGLGILFTGCMYLLVYFDSLRAEIFAG